MTKRIVILKLNGLRKIIGEMDVPPDAQYLPEIQTTDYATVQFVEARPHYVLYKEVAHVTN
jgi:hypothetical protein